MEKKKIAILTIVVFVVGLIITGASYAFWSWTSNVNKNVVFNTASNLRNYIIYNEGESAFTGELNVSNSYQTGSIHSTISIYKTTDVNLLATIHMDINQIGPNMKVSRALKWVVTEGTSSNPGTVLAQGNFVGTNNGDVLTLVPDIPVNTTETFYTIWIWLDSSENPSDNLSGETLDTNVWTEINQAEGSEDRYEITNTNANYQQISATVVDSKYKVTAYAITQTNTEPSSWTTITPATDQNNVYTLNTSVSGTGTYYVWFKDENGRVKSKQIQVSATDTSAPSCTWGTFSQTGITDNMTSTIVLTCTDADSGISVHNLQTGDITLSNSVVTITDIVKESVTNGYKYTITVTGTSTEGTTNLTLDANKVINDAGIGNASVSSGNITVAIANYLNVITNNYYTTLNAAFSDVQSNQTIQALNSVTETSTAILSGNKIGVKLDLNGQTITMGTNRIENNSELDIYNGSSTLATLTGSSSSSTGGVLKNSGTLTVNSTMSTNPIRIQNTGNTTSVGIINDTGCNLTLYENSTIAMTATQMAGTRYIIDTRGSVYIYGAELNANVGSSSNKRGINISGTSAKVVMTSGSIITRGEAIYNTSGTNSASPTIRISGGTITSVASTAIYNDVAGRILITGGDITGAQNGIYNRSTGLLTIGSTISGAPDVNSPSITSTATSGNYYGVYVNSTSSTFNFYSGRIASSRVGYALNTTADNIANIPSNCIIVKNEEVSLGEVATLLYDATPPTGTISSLLIGDINGDGTIKATDGTQITLYLNGSTNFTEEQMAKADVNFDGSITEDDGTYVKRYAMGSTLEPLILPYADNKMAVALTLGDSESGVAGYYIGITEPNATGSNVTWTDMTSSLNTNITIYQIITGGGTYWLGVKDVVGNVFKTSVPIYTITYNANGGTGTLYRQLKMHDFNVFLAGTYGLANDGYIVDDWNTEIDGSGISYISKTAYSENASITLYANWVDNIAPTGTVTTSYNNNTITALVTVTDAGSGPKASYGYKVSTSTTCNSSVTGFVDSTDNSYNFNINQSGLHYVCVRIEDNAGNFNYIKAVSSASYIDYDYTGEYQTFTAPQDGYYKVETWGGQGGQYTSAQPAGKGGYSSGYIHLNANDNLYVYVGGQGQSTTNNINYGGWNGGGASGTYSSPNNGGGGGATDIRATSGSWNDATSLNSRIMVAAGGGGAGNYASYSISGGNGGTLVGGIGESTSTTYGTSSYQPTGGSQKEGGTSPHIGSNSTGQFGYANQTSLGTGYGGGGGAGYYGGAEGFGTGGSGGSSFISGYAGVNAINSSRTHTDDTLHYSNRYFIAGVMEAGVRNGAGQAKITYYGETEPDRINEDLNNVRYIKDCINGSTAATTNIWVEIQTIKDGVNLAKGKTVTGTVAENSSYPYSKIVDGIIVPSTSNGRSSSTGLQCVTVDLGQTYNLDEVAIWHWYGDGRTYNNNTTYVSSDNSSWVTLINVTEPETANGKRINAWQLTPEYRAVTYNANGGSGTPAPTTYAYATSGTVNLSSTIPTRVGYTFLGWSTSSTATTATYTAGQAWSKSNASQTLYAVWRINVLTVRMRTGGATIGNSSYSGDPFYTYNISYNGTVAYNWPVDYSPPYGAKLTRDGYSPTGYYHVNSANASTKILQDLVKNSDGEPATTVASALGVLSAFQSGDVTVDLYPGWQSTTYTITYNANGGSGAPSPTTYTYATSGTTNLSSVIPTRTGHTFLGWSQSSTATSAQYSAGQAWNLSNANNYTLYAVWRVNTYTITYNANGGSGAPSSQTYTYATSGTTNLSSTVPTRSNYSFVGWSLSSTATTASYTAGQAWSLSNANNYTLYAVWNSLECWWTRVWSGSCRSGPGSSYSAVEAYYPETYYTIDAMTTDWVHAYFHGCWVERSHFAKVRDGQCPTGGSGDSGTTPTNPGGGGCFLAGTKIKTVYGFTDIDKIKVGDMVLSYNEVTNKNEYKLVEKVFIHENNTEDLYSLTIENKILKVTEAHRFYIKRNNEILWLPANELKIGDMVRYANGTYHKITKIAYSQQTNTVYNFKVEDNHNYYVTEDMILVHNTKVIDDPIH